MSCARPEGFLWQVCADSFPWDSEESSSVSSWVTVSVSGSQKGTATPAAQSSRHSEVRGLESQPVCSGSLPFPQSPGPSGPADHLAHTLSLIHI